MIVEYREGPERMGPRGRVRPGSLVIVCWCLCCLCWYGARKEVPRGVPERISWIG